MFVYSLYRWALFRTNTNLLKINCSRRGWGGGGGGGGEGELFHKDCEWNKSFKFCISFLESNNENDNFYTWLNLNKMNCTTTLIFQYLIKNANES